MSLSSSSVDHPNLHGIAIEVLSSLHCPPKTPRIAVTPRLGSQGQRMHLGLTRGVYLAGCVFLSVKAATPLSS